MKIFNYERKKENMSRTVSRILSCDSTPDMSVKSAKQEDETSMMDLQNVNAASEGVVKESSEPVTTKSNDESPRI
jgi:hypothetical protein